MKTNCGLFVLGAIALLATSWQLASVPRVDVTAAPKPVRCPTVPTLPPRAPRHKVAYLALTQDSMLGPRLGPLMRAWGTLASVRLIATDKPASPHWWAQYPQLTPMPEYGGMKNLSRKVLAMWGRMCSDSSFTGVPSGGAFDNVDTATGKVERADWFVMVDDDTYVVVPNLHAFLAGLDPNAHFYGGCVLTFAQYLPPFVSGGAGIILSRRTLSALCDARHSNKSMCSPRGTRDGPGDTAVVRCMQELGVNATHVTGMVPLDVRPILRNATYCRGIWWWPTHMPCEAPRTLLSFHYVRDMTAVHALLRGDAVDTRRAAVPMLSKFPGPSKEQIEKLRPKPKIAVPRAPLVTIGRSPANTSAANLTKPVLRASPMATRPRAPVELPGRLVGGSGMPDARKFL